MRYLLFSLFTLTIFTNTVLGQAPLLEDAVRYSQLDVGGTARSVAIGGGMGALGGDFSVASTNPAGLAMFRRSEFTFTPTFVNSSDESQLEGQNDPYSRNKFNFNFNNIGLVFPSRPSRSLNWTNTAFGFGLNRLGGYQQKAYFEGTSAGSITDRWVELADGFSPDNLGVETGLAFDAEAIYNPDENNPSLYASDFLPEETLWRSQNIKRKGSYNELVFSYAGNYKERLMIGATVGIPLVNFEETKTYTESDEEGTNPVFNELTYVQRLTTSGAGINFKLGVIYRASQMVRLGAAIHTPTGIGLKDDFSANLDYSYSIDGTILAGAAETTDNTFEYRMRTPWRVIGSAALVFSKSGFLTAEVEYLDYTNAKFNFTNAADGGDPNYEANLNQQVKDRLTSAVNIRLGGEYALDKFRFRGGYAISQPAYADGFEPIGTLSLGAGAWWSEGFFMDIAYRRQLSEGLYSPYVFNDEPQQYVSQKDVRNHFLVTLGFKF
jgi:long-subunit fatty acid transport protein